MMVEDRFDITDYHITYDTGTMLPNPLETLPPYFEPWNRLAKSVPKLVHSRKLREAVDQMPLLDFTKLKGHRQHRLAHLQLCLLTAGYVWQEGDAGVSKSLPACIAVPFYRISEKLGIHSVLSHPDIALANWALIDPSKPLDIDNLRCLYDLPGARGGQWFCIVTFMVEFCFAKSLKDIENILNIMRSGARLEENSGKPSLELGQEKEDAIASSLLKITQVIKRMQWALSQMHRDLDASTFFNVLRPFLGGWGGESNPLPDGLIYTGISNTPIQETGGSAAQSTSLQAFDALLGVKHSDDKRAFLVKMRSFMLPPHRRFIQDIEDSPYKLDLLVRKSSNFTLVSAYNACVDALVKLRAYHIQIVTKYVVVASKQINQGMYESLDAVGTGGTNLIPFLKDIRIDTEEKMMEDSVALDKTIPEGRKLALYCVFAAASLCLSLYAKYVISDA